MTVDTDIEAIIHRDLAEPHRLLGAHADNGGVVIRTYRPDASKVTGAVFNIAVAFEASETGGPAIAQSTFHHFADYNWDPGAGCPSFVSEPPGDGINRFPEALRSTKQYVSNIAFWLAA